MKLAVLTLAILSWTGFTLWSLIAAAPLAALQLAVLAGVVVWLGNFGAQPETASIAEAESRVR